MAADTTHNPRVYVIYGMDKIWGIADTYPELDKLCQYLNKSSRKDMLSDFEIVVFDGKKVVGRLPFSHHTDLLYPEHLVFKTDF